MTFEVISGIVFGVIGGLGLFLYGMKQMSEGMQAVAGERLRKMISMATENRFIACGVGSIVTATIQSSSVTTVMVVGMVNAGIMTLKQATGVIMGTNIGTTITGWLIALHVADYGLPVLGIAALFFLFSKNEKVQFTSMFFLGLGMVFFGLELMKDGLKPLREFQTFIDLMAAFEPTTIVGLLKCVFTGTLITALIQSSSATVAITITLATTGAISYEAAVALVLGENIGTTVTAFLASLGTNLNAKRAAFAHILFNLTGALIMITFFKLYISFLTTVFPDTIPIASRIAFAHSFFNIFIVAILLPLVTPFTALVVKLVKSKATSKPYLTTLDIRMYDTPSLAIEQSHYEIKKMAADVDKMLDWLNSFLAGGMNDKKLEKKLFKREKKLDVLQKEIVEFISHMLKGNLSQSLTTEARNQLRIADELESISDYIVAILKLALRLNKNGLNLSKPDQAEILKLNNSIMEYHAFISEIISDSSRQVFSTAQCNCEAVIHQIKDSRNKHLKGFEAKESSPFASIIFLDMLNSYRRIQDHAYNIAETVFGEK